jgi:hypothetical protein
MIGDLTFPATAWNDSWNDYFSDNGMPWISAAGPINSVSEKDNLFQAICLNTAVDFFLKKYYSIMFGLDFSESAFPIHDELAGLCLDETGKKFIEAIAADADLGKLIQLGNKLTLSELFVRNDKVKEFFVRPDLFKLRSAHKFDNQPIHGGKFASVGSILNTVLAQGRYAFQKALTPSLFDRTFLIPFDINEFEIDVNATVLTIGLDAWEAKLGPGGAADGQGMVVSHDDEKYYLKRRSDGSDFTYSNIMITIDRIVGPDQQTGAL